MKFFKVLALTFLCLVAYLSKTYAQSDYVITVNNDTIKCNISADLFNNRFIYRANKNDHYRIIKGDFIIHFFSSKDSSTYVFKSCPNDTSGGTASYYLKWIERGKINLYERHVMAGSATVPYWYASKENGPLILIKAPGPFFLHADEVNTPKEQKKNFLDFFTDTPSSREKFQSEMKNSYSYDDILKCIHSYNEEIAYNESDKWDYLITQKNDTILCKIKYDFISKCYFFRSKNQNNNYNKIDSSSAKEFFYSIENTTYLLKIVPEQNQKVFVKWIERGRINLFEKTIIVNHRDEETIRYYWYVSKDNGELIPIKTDAKYIYDIRSHKELLNAFRNVLSDNKNVLKDFNDDLHYVTFNTDIIIHLYISKYNADYLKNNNIQNP